MSSGLGNKHQCGKCTAKFYDLNQTPAVCPKCGTQVKVKKASRARSPSAAVAAAVPKPVKKKPKPEIEVDTLAGMGHVVELEELDDFAEDLEHLEEVEDHQEGPETSVNSDDADDEMFIEEIHEKEVALFDPVTDEEEITEEDRDTL
jgi:uncharacterized protein (TIGR02300 family)